MNCNRSTAHEVFVYHANHRTLGYLHSPYSDFVRRGARPRCDPHWLGLGDSRGRREASGRENQERQVYQEARRKRKMSRIISATLTRNQLIRKGPWVRIPPSPPEITPVVGFSGCWLFFFQFAAKPKPLSIASAEVSFEL